MRGIKVALFLKRRYYDWESIILTFVTNYCFVYVCERIMMVPGSNKVCQPIVSHRWYHAVSGFR